MVYQDSNNLEQVLGAAYAPPGMVVDTVEIGPDS